jgi:ethanolamine utilization protein EutM
LVKTIPIGGGLITVLAQGDVGSVKAAVDAGSKAAAKVGELVSSHVIARPHDDLAERIPREPPRPRSEVTPTLNQFQQRTIMAQQALE